jgi:hypothetical protein
MRGETPTGARPRQPPPVADAAAARPAACIPAPAAAPGAAADEQPAEASKSRLRGVKGKGGSWLVHVNMGHGTTLAAGGGSNYFGVYCTEVAAGMVRDVVLVWKRLRRRPGSECQELFSVCFGSFGGQCVPSPCRPGLPAMFSQSTCSACLGVLPCPAGATAVERVLPCVPQPAIKSFPRPHPGAALATELEALRLNFPPRVYAADAELLAELAACPDVKALKALLRRRYKDPVGATRAEEAVLATHAAAAGTSGLDMAPAAAAAGGGAADAAAPEQVLPAARHAWQLLPDGASKVLPENFHSLRLSQARHGGRLWHPGAPRPRLAAAGRWRAHPPHRHPPDVQWQGRCVGRRLEAGAPATWPGSGRHCRAAPSRGGRPACSRARTAGPCVSSEGRKGRRAHSCSHEGCCRNARGRPAALQAPGRRGGAADYALPAQAAACGRAVRCPQPAG